MTLITRFSLTVVLTLTCTLLCSAQEQQKEEATNASTTENAVGPIDGEGTVGKIPKFTGTNSIGNSIITESSGRVAISSPVAPIAILHVHEPVLPSQSGDGTDATPLFQTSGGKGGNTTAGGQTAGDGASIFLMAGNGGDAPAGGTRGNGGNITLQPGGAGGGVGTGGEDGHVLLVPNRGNVAIGRAFGVPVGSKLEVLAGDESYGVRAFSNSHIAVSASSVSGYGVYAASESGYAMYGDSESSVGVFGNSGSGTGVYGNSSSGIGVYGEGFGANSVGVYGVSTRGLAGSFEGNVQITGNELFGSSRRQMINLFDTTFGIGIQSGTFYFRANGGFAWFKGGTHNNNMNNPGAGGVLQMRLDAAGNLHTTGAVNPSSDRQMKANFTAVNPRSVLNKLASLPIQTWSYKAEDNSVRHIGPVAQDFRAAFNLGADDKHISTVDADGVTMAAIQGLYQMLLEKEKENEQLARTVKRQNSLLASQSSQIELLHARLLQLERQVSRRARGKAHRQR